MTLIHNKLGLAVIGALLLMLVAAVAGGVLAGPLDPPTSPGSTQENLIFQPATCADFPIVISSPGSYKLAQNITGCSGKNGINITAADVELDLNGFRVSGVGGSLIGISATGYGDSVKNGTITLWGGDGLNAAGGGQFSNLTILVNSGKGLVVSYTSSLTNITADSNIVANISLSIHTTIDGCAASFSPGVGIEVRAGGGKNVINNCTIDGNGAGGFVSSGSQGDQLSQVTASGNSGNGFSLVNGSTLTNCVAQNNGTGIVAIGSTVSLCTTNNNSANGVTLTGGSQLMDCVATANTGFGVLVSGDRDAIERCDVTNNGAEGIKVTGASNKVARSHAVDNAGAVGGCAQIWVVGTKTLVEDNTAEYAGAECGIYLDGASTSSIVVRNVVRGPATDYFTGCGSCDVGTITTAAAATNPQGNVAE
jgi:hypothetical protein